MPFARDLALDIVSGENYFKAIDIGITTQTDAIVAPIIRVVLKRAASPIHRREQVSDTDV